MLVPEIVLSPPLYQSDRMQTPGAAIVWSLSVSLTAKFENVAYLSSDSPDLHAGGPPVPPALPSLSDMAVTVRTSG